MATNKSALPGFATVSLVGAGALAGACPPVQMGCFAGAAVCAATGFPRTKLEDDTPLVTAGIFGMGAAAALSKAPKTPAMYGVAAALGAGMFASLHLLGLSSAERAVATEKDSINVQIADASAGLNRRLNSISSRF